MAQSFNLTARINLTGPFNLKPIVSKIKKDIGSINPNIKFKLDPAAAKSVAKVTSEIKKLDAATKNAQKSVGSLNAQLSALASSFNSASAASKNAANATANVGRATASTAKSINEARTLVEEFGKQSGLAIKRFAAFSSVTAVVFGLTSALSSAYKEFLVFNKELVRLSQITGKPIADLKGISEEITRLSTSIGVSSSELIEISTILAQAGLSAQDTKIALEALAKSTLAPNFKDIQNTTEGAIAAIRQFGLEAKELDSVLGSINAVAGAFAVEADDIVSAIQRTGGVFASTSRGVTEGADALNEFIAIFTSVRQTTRESAETIATGLRTIFTRIQRSSTIDLLKQYGVELRDLEGKFVGPFEAVKRLNEGLSGLDPRSAAFAKISEELGGFRQIGKVIPLIQQFGVAQEALNVAQKGSGSLTKDVITAQQAIAVQFTKTRESFLALIRDIGESQSFKVFVGTTLTLTNALISLGQALKPILPLLLTFGAIKAGGAINQFVSGFGLAFGGAGRGGGGGAGAAGGGSSSPVGGGPGGNQPLTSALTINTTATNALVQTLGTLNTTVSSLNQSMILLVNRPSPPGFARGGLVPGSGNTDSVAASLTPGEFVIRKPAVESIGVDNLKAMNSGGKIQKFMAGSTGGVSRKSSKRAIVTDFDDTVAESDAVVKQGAADPYEDFRGQRAVDFIKKAKATRYAEMIKKRVAKGYDVHVLTARPNEPDTLEAIQEFMTRAVGARATSVIATAELSARVGGVARAKASELSRLKQTYDQIIFLDDNGENVLAGSEVQGVRARIAKKFEDGGVVDFFQKALSSYVMDSAEINTSLASGKTTPDVESSVKSLDQLFKYSPPSQLFSGFGKNRTAILTDGIDPSIPEFVDLIEGVRTFPGYLSSSENKDVADRFRGRGGAGALVTVEPKAPVIDVRTAVKDLGLSLPKGRLEEEEFIFPRQSRFMIDDFEYSSRTSYAKLKQLNSGGPTKRFASGGTVPAMVSNGEAFVPPNVAKKIGYSKLDKMNKADRNGMKGFSGGGISVFKGSGNGTSDSIGPIGLPTGSYVIREKATAALGLNKGGMIQKFARGSRGAVKAQTSPQQLTKQEKILQRIFGDNFVQGKGIVTAKTLASGQTVEQIIPLSRIQTAKSSYVLERASGIEAAKFANAKKQLSDLSELSLKDKQKLRVTEKLEKRSAIQQNRVLDFGLVGLRYGSSSDKSKSEDATRFDIPIPPGFVEKRYNVQKVSDTGNAFARIKSATIGQGLTDVVAQQFQESIIGDFEKSVARAATNMANFDPSLGLSASSDPNLIRDAVLNAEFYNVIGSGLEAALGVLGGKIIAKTEQTKSIDFPEGLGSASKLFGSRFEKIPTDVTRTIGGEGKSIARYKAQIGRWLTSDAGKKYLNDNFPNVTGFADGGSVVSSQDTVAARLTPGEFVLNKETSESIGYGTLNRLNKGGKIKGFNKGGVVGLQKFRTGGSVTSDPTIIGAALISVLLPEIQKLASSFGKLEGAVGNFGSALGGAIREASSTVLSASLGLTAVGASQTTIRTAQLAGGTTAAIAGGLSDVSSRLLEKALLKNTSALNKFEKNLQDITTAPTQEVRAEAVKRLEKSFNDLEISLRNSKSGIDNLENLKNLGQSIGNFNITVLSTVTAMTALSAASKQAALTVASARLAQAGQIVAVSTATRVLAGIGRFIPQIGMAILGISAIVEGVSFFSSRLKSSSEQFERLNDALDKTIQNSESYNLSNRNFVFNILQKFQGIANRARLENIPLTEAIGPELENPLSRLNIRLRSLAIPGLSESNIAVGGGENLDDVRNRLIRTTPELVDAFDTIITKTQEYSTRLDAISFLRRERGLDAAQAETEVSRLESKDPATLKSFGDSYAAAKTVETMSSRLVADSMNRLQSSVMSLTNIMNLSTASYQKSLTNTANSFEDLDRKVNILSGSVDFDISSIATRDIKTFENLAGSSNQDVLDAGKRFTTAFKFPSEIATKIQQQVQASKILQDSLGTVLEKVSQGGAGDIGETLETTIRPALENILGDGFDAQDTINNIIKELETSIRSSAAEGKGPKSIEELVGSISGLSSVFSSGEKTVKFVIDTLGLYGKGLQDLSAQQKKTLELENLVRQKTIERIQADKKASFQFREIFDIDIPLSEKLGLADTRTIESTRNVGGIGPQGTTDIGEIIKQRAVAKQRIQELETLSQKSIILSSDQTAELESNKSALIRLTEVVKNVAESGEGVNLVFEQIAKQRDQFKTDREVLFDILQRSRDPVQQVQLEREFQAVNAVLSGRFSDDQAFTALGSNLTRVLTPALKEAFNQRIGLGLVGNARPSTPEETGAVFRTMLRLLLGGADPQTTSILATEKARVDAASEDVKKDLTDSLEVRTQRTITIFDVFNDSILKTLTNTATTIENLMNMFNRTSGLGPTEIITDINATAVAEIQKLLKEFNPRPKSRLDTFVNILGLDAANRFTGGARSSDSFLNPEEQKNISAEITKALSQGRSIADIFNLVRERVSQIPVTAEDFRRNEDGNIVPAPAITEAFSKFFEKLRRIQDETTRPRPPVPASRSVAPIMQGASIDPGSRRTLDTLATTTRQLATALTGDNTNINSLSAAVTDLMPITNNLTTAVNELGKLFKDGKIQLDNKATGSVSVTFENGIPLETESGLDSKIVDNVRTLLNSTLDQKLASFVRELTFG